MNEFERGVLHERERVEALLGQYEIIELLGGAIMLVPVVVKPDRSWKGAVHKTGSLSSYFRRGCRCDTCKEFVSEYQKQRRLIRRGLA